jgi:hypothetical protein
MGHENYVQSFVGKPKITTPHGKPRRSWEDNIKINLTEMEWEDVDWIQMDEDRKGSVVGFCVHGNESSVSIKGGDFLD